MKVSVPTKILCVGGGSGGHVTPVVAVVRELKKAVPDAQINFVCDRKFAAKSRELFGPLGISVSIVASGKLRRYANLSFVNHLRHFFKTYVRNVWDMCKVCVGFVQSLWLIGRLRPDVVFAKGGFVCLPVGMAAKVWKVPIVIHDSDAHPGLTNRILARYATAIGTGSPVEFYPSYPKSRTKYVGIPVRNEFRKLSPAEKLTAKKKLGFDPKKPLIVATGGGLGAESINDAIRAILPQLIAKNCAVLLLTGQAQFDIFEDLNDAKNDIQILPFIGDGMAEALGAADVVVTRAGATTIAELAAVAAPIVLVPSPYLASNHQMKNAQVFADAGAALCVDEREFGDSAEPLWLAISEILNDDMLAKMLGDNLYKFAKPNALNDMANMILLVAKGKRNVS